MKFSMCNEFCEGWDFASVCQLAQEAGYQGVEIAPFTLAPTIYGFSDDLKRQVRRAAEERGLQIAGLHWLLSRTNGLHVTHPDPQVRKKTIDYLAEEVDVCAELGGSVLVMGSPNQRNVQEGQSYEDAWARAVEVFGAVAPRARGRGVTFCIEPLAPPECNFIQTAAEARRMVEEIDDPGFRMMLDVKAMSAEQTPIPELVGANADYLTHFHANDANLQGPGFGDTDFGPIAAALKEAGYDGWVSVEVFDFSVPPEKTAHESLRYLREVFQ